MFFRCLILLVAALTAVSCSAGGAGSSIVIDTSSSVGSQAAMVTNMPTRITPSTPANLVDQQNLKLKSPRRFAVSATNTGGAYEQLKSFAEMGVTVSLSIQEILSNVAVSNIYAYLLSHQGHKTTVAALSGAWVYFNTNGAGSTFLYYGESAAITNLYIDWVATNGGFNGKAVWYVPASDTNSDFDEGTFLYDSTSLQPSLDMFLKTRVSNSMNFKDFRVLLRGDVTNHSVAASANVAFTGARYGGTLSFVTGWDMVGYAKLGENGGVKAWTTGTYNTNWGTNWSTSGTFPFSTFTVQSNAVYRDTNIVTASNYVYTEYFGPTGLTLYAAGIADARWSSDQFYSLTNTVQGWTSNIYKLTTNYTALTGSFAVSNWTYATNLVSTPTQAAASNYFEAVASELHVNLAQTNYLDPEQSLTSGTEPADVKAVLDSLAGGRMTNGAYPLNTLPPILP